MSHYLEADIRRKIIKGEFAEGQLCWKLILGHG